MRMAMYEFSLYLFLGKQLAYLTVLFLGKQPADRTIFQLYPPVTIDFPVVDPPCEFEALQQAVKGFQNVIAALENVTDFSQLSTKLTEGGTTSLYQSL